MTTEDVFRVVIICVGLVELGLMVAWLVPRLRSRRLPTGEVLARAGGAFLVAGVVYGAAEVLFGWPLTLRLPLILIGLTWMTLGLISSLVNDRRYARDRHAGERSRRPGREDEADSSQR